MAVFGLGSRVGQTTSDVSPASSASAPGRAPDVTSYTRSDLPKTFLNTEPLCHNLRQMDERCWRGRRERASVLPYISQDSSAGTLEDFNSVSTSRDGDSRATSRRVESFGSTAAKSREFGTRPEECQRADVAARPKAISSDSPRINCDMAGQDSGSCRPVAQGRT
jgi:hypothetical protein